MQLEMWLDSLAEELAEVTEERDKLSKRVKFLGLLEEIYQGKDKGGEARIAGAKLEKLSNVLADAIYCSRGRLLQTLIGAVKDYLETLEVQSQEDPKFKNLKSEASRKTEKLKKIEEEKEVIEEVLFSVRKELKQVKASVTKEEPARKTEVAEVGIQVSLNMVDASTEPQEEAWLKQ